MSSVYLKISSLLIRTLSKPIANRIKQQAREHEGFRRICVSFAQSMHRLDMQLRLGLLQDHASIDRQIAKDAAYAAAKKKARDETMTAKTEAQTKADDAIAAREKRNGDSTKDKGKISQPKIRPLSEAKAIDSGANFISEGFLFSVGLGLIILESWRSRRKENNRRLDVAARIEELETQNRTISEKLEGVDGELKEIKDIKAKGGWAWFGMGTEQDKGKRGSLPAIDTMKGGQENVEKLPDQVVTALREGQIKNEREKKEMHPSKSSSSAASISIAHTNNVSRQG